MYRFQRRLSCAWASAASMEIEEPGEVLANLCELLLQSWWKKLAILFHDLVEARQVLTQGDLDLIMSAAS